MALLWRSLLPPDRLKTAGIFTIPRYFHHRWQAMARLTFGRALLDEFGSDN